MMCSAFVFFNDTAATEIYTLSLHDALPISCAGVPRARRPGRDLRRVRLAPSVQRAGPRGPLRGGDVARRHRRRRRVHRSARLRDPPARLNRAEEPMAYEAKRDFIGYGANPPDPRWPGGARLAVNFVINYEEGSEPSVQDGEGFTESGLTESSGLNQLKSGRDLAAEGMFEYGSRVGFWRLRRLFQERGLPLTVFACALALERNPEAAAAIRDSGWDICSHGWRWVKHFEMDEAEEREHIRKAAESLERTVGKAEGWYCRYGPSVNTRRLVVEHGGFLYDSDYYGDELPFWVTVDGEGQLVGPYSLRSAERRVGKEGRSRG